MGSPWGKGPTTVCVKKGKWWGIWLSLPNTEKGWLLNPPLEWEGKEIIPKK